MTELYELMMKRRSVRNFEDRPIRGDIVRKLQGAANNAPTGGNIQPISIITVADEKARKDLGEMFGRQPWVAKAPLSLIFCIDFHRLKRWAFLLGTEFKGERSLSHFLISYADLMCAAQNVVILAESLGLGSVYIGTVQSAVNEVREYFEMPEYVLPLMVLCIGYPKSIPNHIPKLKTGDIIHSGKYRVGADDDIRKMFDDKYGDLDDNIENYLKRAFVESVEAAEQADWADLEKIKKEMEKQAIKNNAQFLFDFRYPQDIMLQLNEHIILSFKAAGFDIFGPPDDNSGGNE
jgi:FMN reductase (NADPH)